MDPVGFLVLEEKAGVGWYLLHQPDSWLTGFNSSSSHARGALLWAPWLHSSWAEKGLTRAPTCTCTHGQWLLAEQRPPITWVSGWFSTHWNKCSRVSKLQYIYSHLFYIWIDLKPRFCPLQQKVVSIATKVISFFPEKIQSFCSPRIWKMYDVARDTLPPNYC